MSAKTAFWLSSILSYGMIVVGMLLYTDIYYLHEAFLSVTILEFVKLFLVINSIVTVAYLWDKKELLHIRVILLVLDILIFIIAVLWARVPEDQLISVTHKWAFPISVTLIGSGLLVAIAARYYRQFNWFLHEG